MYKYVPVLVLVLYAVPPVGTTGGIESITQYLFVYTVHTVDYLQAILSTRMYSIWQNQ